MIKKVLCIFFSGALFLGVLQAQEPEAGVSHPLRISPGEAVEMAIKNNLSLESSRVATETRRRASDLSWNQFIPNVTVAGSLMMDLEKSTIDGLAYVPWRDEMGFLGLNQNDVQITIPGFGTMYNWVTPFSIDAPWWRIVTPIQTSLTVSLAMFENMNRLRLDYEGGLISYERAKLQLERDIRKAYNNMLLLQENMNLMNESLAAAQRRVDLAGANFRAGLVPELMLLQAQVAMENMRPVIDQVENGMRLSMARFAMFLGLPYDTPFELVPVNTDISFIPLDVKELISQAASGRPDIRELRHNILLLESVRKTQANTLLPSLTLTWNPSLVFTRNPIEDKVESRWVPGSFTIALGLRLHSLLPFSVDSQAMRNTDDKIRMANIGLAQMIQGTEIEIYNTVLSLERTRITTEAQSQTVNLAERSFRLTEEAYRAGLQDLLQVQNAELELRQARVSMLEQQFNYLNSLIDLEYAIGVPYGTLSSTGE